MTASTGDVPGRIFMSYRREDTAFPAGWLYDRLTGHFGKDQVFKDIDSIELGDDFIEVITTAVGSCDVLLALIGGRWLTITGQDGRRRLDNPDDFVRLEIEAALARGVRVIPIVVDAAQMPRADELPSSLAKLARRQALELSPSRFDTDAQRLLRVLDRTVAEAQEQARHDAEEAAARQVEQLQGRLRERAAVQDWDAVVAVSGELAALDPASADPDGLASAAREQITRRQEAEQEAEEAAAREEAERKAREEADRKARQKAERKARQEAERKAREGAERKARQEAEEAAAVEEAEPWNEPWTEGSENDPLVAYRADASFIEVSRQPEGLRQHPLWSAVLVKKTRKIRSLKVRLTRETHNVVFMERFFDRAVFVDGEKKASGAPTGRRDGDRAPFYNFTLSDGNEVRYATYTLLQGSAPLIADSLAQTVTLGVYRHMPDFLLTIDGEVLYPTKLSPRNHG